jgi:hypothetical protein
VLAIEKKVVAAERHKKVAEEFGKWVAANPNESLKRKVEIFDAFCDASLIKP